MKLKSYFLIALLVPAALYAQTMQKDSMKELQKLGLPEAQVTQVLDIQNKAQATVKADIAQLRILQAQIDKALLPSASVDLKAVNALIDQKAQARADLEKAFTAAKVQVRQIMGDDNYAVYARFLRHSFMREDGMRPYRDGSRFGKGGMMTPRSPGSRPGNAQPDVN